MSKNLTRIAVAVMIVGGIASWGLIPKSWFNGFPAWGQMALVTCVIIFSAAMLLGYVLDSGLLQRMLKRKNDRGTGV